jgi:glucosamine--fructose-6-phosphate aminotransferase (isomerizing)
MCGIIGYVGDREADKILVEGLKALEYRGYDSAGIAVINSTMNIFKNKGRVSNLEGVRIKGKIGIGHTRWATHGEPSRHNAHPHLDCSEKIAVVHNGIIENFLELKQRMRRHIFTSETDSEVLAHLIEANYKGDLFDAVTRAIKVVKGAYALCAIHLEKKEIVAARNGSPIVIGVGEGENFVASDVTALAPYTKKMIYLKDFEVARIRKDEIKLYNFERQKVKPEIKISDWDYESAQKKGFKHFMLKEIHEQPDVVKETLNVPIDTNFNIKGKVFLVACGTASYAAMVGKYIIEKMSGRHVEVDNASEFRYREPLIGMDDLLIVVSQSGETADTLAALRLAKRKGVKTIAIINVMDSTIAREADNVIYTRAGIEVSVASTKAFLSQLVVLYLIAQKISGKKLVGLQKIPELIRQVLKNDNKIRDIAKKYYKVYNFFYIGRNLNYPIALEGALKLKEISYIHAEGYASGELKHGPISLVTDEIPTIAIAPQDAVYEKMLSNIGEIKARKGKVIAIATHGDKKIKEFCEDVIYIPRTNELLTPLLTVIPLQLFAYHVADCRKCDIDKPRNLAKSVTVE